MPIPLYCCYSLVYTLAMGPGRESVGLASSGLTALVWENGPDFAHELYIQNVTPDCTLGIEHRLR
jgi:hypothetical protein